MCSLYNRVRCLLSFISFDYYVLYIYLDHINSHTFVCFNRNVTRIAQWMWIVTHKRGKPTVSTASELWHHSWRHHGEFWQCGGFMIGRENGMFFFYLQIWAWSDLIIKGLRSSNLKPQHLSLNTLASIL